MARAHQFLAALLLVIGLEVPAAGEGVITSFIGGDFAGKIGSRTKAPARVTDDVTYGVAAAFMSRGLAGGVLGLEEDITFAPHFFPGGSRRAPGGTTIAISNLIVGMPLGLAPLFEVGGVGLMPYAVGGFGLIHGESLEFSEFANEVSHDGVVFNIGVGSILFISKYVGIRADLRHIHSFADVNASAFDVSEQRLKLWSGRVGVVYRFGPR